MKISPQEVVSTLRAVLVSADGDFVPLHEPTFAGPEWDCVKQCLDSGWVSTAGEFVTRFERELARFCGVKRAVAVCNGTAALHASLVLAGVQPGDEVVIPSLTFVATANAVHYAGAVPHFADAEPVSLGIDPAKLRDHLDRIAVLRDGACVNRETGRRIAALVPMHTFGHPSRMDELLALADDYGLVLIEDAAEALGSYFRGIHAGGLGRLGALSFNGNKIITTGGGGAILTNDEALADRARHLTTTAKLPHRWRYDHDQIGYNYRLPNLNAALGVAQLGQLPKLLRRKRALIQSYADAFRDSPGVTLVTEPPESRSNYWLATLLLDPGSEPLLEPVLKATNDAGLMTRPSWTPLHQLQPFRHCPRMDLAAANSLAQRLINIPSSAHLVPALPTTPVSS